MLTVFLDRMEGFSRQAFEREFAGFWETQGGVLAESYSQEWVILTGMARHNNVEGLSFDGQRCAGKEEVLAEIKSVQQQLRDRLANPPDRSAAFPQRYLNIEAENALIDRVLELFNATGLTARQAKNCP